MTELRFPAFRRVKVDCLVPGGTKISWDLDPRLVDPGPYYFQLEVSRSAVRNSPDWEVVGSEAEEVFFLGDPVQRLRAHHQETYYRVRLRTAEHTYYSEPEHCFGVLDQRGWLLGREILRKETLRHKQFASNTGFLLRRKRPHDHAVEVRQGVIDPLTDEILTTHVRSDEAEDYGIGLLGGYYRPIPCVFFDVEPEKQRVFREPEQTRQTARAGAERKSRAIAFPLPQEGDVWVDGKNDRRYYLHGFEVIARIRDVPIVIACDMRLAPYTDPIYQVPIDLDEYDPSTGSGSVDIDHNTDGVDMLQYTNPQGQGIDGTVIAFRAADYNAGLRAATYQQARVETGEDGRWLQTMHLNPGVYILVFEKTGWYGPDLVELTVEEVASSSL